MITSEKDGAGCQFEKELVDADVVISQPFWPAYMTKERFAMAKNLKMVVTAGIGSDHTDLQSAIDRKVTVAEVTFCNRYAWPLPLHFLFDNNIWGAFAASQWPSTW